MEYVRNVFFFSLIKIARDGINASAQAIHWVLLVADRRTLARRTFIITLAHT